MAEKITTVLSATGILKVAEGSVIELNGENIANMGPHKIVKRGVSLSPEGREVFPSLTVEENLRLGAFPVRNQKKLVSDGYERVCQLFPRLKERLKQQAGTLSGGEQQMLAIGRSLMGNPKLLLLDEPFGALDAFTRMSMQQEVLRIWEQDKTTMMIVTHDIDEAIYLSSRVVIMGKNPGVVKKIVPVNLPFPRDRTDPAFLEIRGEIMKEFLET